jgi:hypothetical protein
MIWVTRIFLKNVDKEKLRQMCEKIEQRDNTFSWKIEGNYLFIFSESKEKAHSRGLLFVKKYLNKFDLGYDVFYKA